MNATIRYYSMNRDEYEAGNGYTCERCGRRHRHVTEINGHVYGKVCGIKVMAELDIIDTTPAANYRLAEITVEDIQNIVNPTRRAFVKQDWINYQVSQATMFNYNWIMGMAKHTEPEKVQQIIDRTVGKDIHNDWTIVQRVQGLVR